MSSRPRVQQFIELLVVGEGGLEPPRPEGHWHLKPARLPFRHSPVAADCSAGMFVGLGGPTDPRTITVGLVGIQTRLLRLVRTESEGAAWVCGCVWFRRGAARSSPSRLNQQWGHSGPQPTVETPAQPAMGTQRAATNSGDAGSTNSGTRGGSFLADPAQPAMGDNARPEHISARRALRW